MKNATWYVYLLTDPITGNPFYAGKGKGRRALWHLKTHVDPNWRKRAAITAIRAAGREPNIVYVRKNLSEQDAFRLEMEIIRRYGRRPVGLLTNMSDGGEGQAGFTLSVNTRQKIAIATTGVKNHFYGKKHSRESLEKIGRINKGKHLSREWRAKLSAATKGKPKSIEHRLKISSALTGRVRSREHAARLAEANRGKVISAETRAKLSAILKGRPKSKETVKNMKQAWILRKLRKDVRA